MNLYEINKGLRELLELAEAESDEEIAEVLWDQIEGFEMAQEDKLRAYACIVLEERAKAEAIANEIKRLTEKKKRHEKTADRLCRGIDMVANGKKMYLGVATWSYRKSESVEITDEDAMWYWLMTRCPEAFSKVEKLTREVNKVELKKFLKSREGEEIVGARIVHNLKGSLR